MILEFQDLLLMQEQHEKDVNPKERKKVRLIPNPAISNIQSYFHKNPTSQELYQGKAMAEEPEAQEFLLFLKNKEL